MTEHLHNGYSVLLAQLPSNKLIANNNFQATKHSEYSFFIFYA